MDHIDIEGILVEDQIERLKVTIPLQRNWLLWGLYMLLLVVWLGMFVYSVYYTFQTAFSGESYAFWLTLFLFIFLFVLYRLGKIVWKQWQYLTANREILFLQDDMLIIRRPVSLLGITNAYDRQHVQPFYFREVSHCPAFDYGSRYILFAQNLDEPTASQLVTLLNGRYFPEHLEDDDEV